MYILWSMCSRMSSTMHKTRRRKICNRPRILYRMWNMCRSLSCRSTRRRIIKYIKKERLCTCRIPLFSLWLHSLQQQVRCCLEENVVPKANGEDAKTKEDTTIYPESYDSEPKPTLIFLERNPFAHIQANDGDADDHHIDSPQGIADNFFHCRTSQYLNYNFIIQQIKQKVKKHHSNNK